VTRLLGRGAKCEFLDATSFSCFVSCWFTRATAEVSASASRFIEFFNCWTWQMKLPILLRYSFDLLAGVSAIVHDLEPLTLKG
jgi:hypothetical protein